MSITRPDPLAAMAAEPWRHDFYVALRLLDNRFPGKPRLGTARKPADEGVRLGQSPELAFAPSTLARVEGGGGVTPPRLEVLFFGLFGPNGPLPLHLTEYARERLLHHSDPTFARFADVFHHRLLLLFYRAWAQAQPTASMDRPGDDRFAEHVASLIGLGTPKHLGRDAASDHAKLFFSGYLANQSRSAEGLQAMLSAYLGKPVRIEAFAGRWLDLPASERTRLSRADKRSRYPTSRLGAGAVLGRRVFDRQHNFRVHVGPLPLAAFEQLLPGADALAAVEALVRHYVSFELGWDARLTLRSDQVPACRLGRHGRLGWTTWIGRRRDADAITLERRAGSEAALTVRPAAHTAARAAATKPPTH